MNYYVLDTSYNWADEIDIDSYTILSEKELNDYKKKIWQKFLTVTNIQLTFVLMKNKSSQKMTSNTCLSQQSAFLNLT